LLAVAQRGVKNADAKRISHARPVCGRRAI
jgi:hypothetical protein